jgi:DNA-binding transcriptional LysR family regulator
MIDPRRLLTFRVVAERRSFSRAAEELSLSQPAVSQQVAALERQAGLELLHRGPGGPSLTVAGELLLAHAGAVAERLAQADAQLGELAAGQASSLRVGAFPSALATLVPRAIRRLRAADARVRVEAVEDATAGLVAAVGAGRLHVAVLFQDAAEPRREHPGTTRHDLAEEPMLAALPPRHRLARRRTVALADLAAETWTAPSTTGLVRQACVAAGFEPEIAYITRDPLAIRSLVAGGLAVTLTPELLAGQLDGIAARGLGAGAPRRALYALTPAAGTTTLARAFVEALHDDRRPP